MTHRQAATLGLVLGVSFAVGAMVTDVLNRARLPHRDVFTDPADFLKSLG